MYKAGICDQNEVRNLTGLSSCEGPWFLREPNTFSNVKQPQAHTPFEISPQVKPTMNLKMMARNVIAAAQSESMHMAKTQQWTALFDTKACKEENWQHLFSSKIWVRRTNDYVYNHF